MQTEKNSTNFWKEYRAYRAKRKQQEKAEKKLRKEEKNTLSREERAANQKQRAEQRKKETVVKWEVLSWVLTLAAAVAVALVLRTFIAEPVMVEGKSMSNTLLDREIVLESKLAYLFGSPQRNDVVICHYPERGGTLFVKRLVALPGDAVEVRALTEEEWNENQEILEKELQEWATYIRSIDVSHADAERKQDVEVMLMQANQIEQMVIGHSYNSSHAKLRFVFVKAKDAAADAAPQRVPIPAYMGRWPSSDFELRVLEDNQYFVIGDNRGNSHDSRSGDVGPLDRSYILGKVKWVIWPQPAWRSVE